MLTMELLERVVGEDHGTDLVGDAEQEGVTPANRTGGRRDDVTIALGLLEKLMLFCWDAMAKGRVYYDRDDVVRPRPAA